LCHQGLLPASYLPFHAVFVATVQHMTGDALGEVWHPGLMPAISGKTPVVKITKQLHA